MNDSRQPDLGKSSQLNWLAFCYVAGELSDSEAKLFELRLEDDAQAQQAVVDVVRESQLIAATQNDLSLSTTTLDNLESQGFHRTRRRLSWSIGIVAACAASFIFIILNGYTPPLQNPNPIARSTAESDILAIAWAQTLVTMTDEEFEETIHDDFRPVDPLTESENWMFVALVDQSEARERNEP